MKDKTDIAYTTDPPKEGMTGGGTLLWAGIVKPEMKSPMETNFIEANLLKPGQSETSP